MTDFNYRVLKKLIEVREELQDYHGDASGSWGDDYNSPSLNDLIDEVATMVGCTYQFVVKKTLFDAAVSAKTLVVNDPRFMEPAVELPTFQHGVVNNEETRRMAIKIHAKGRRAAEDLFFREFGISFEKMREVDVVVP